ncbi:MAG: hypothetical protein U1F87_00040 [Kiritimatiellia bacterium]
MGDLTLGDAATQVNFELGHPDDGLRLPAGKRPRPGREHPVPARGLERDPEGRLCHDPGRIEVAAL